MRTLRRPFAAVAVLALFAACAEAPPPAVVPPPAGSPPTAATAAAAATPTTAPTAAVDPTSLSPEDRQRDAANEPLAKSIVDAYSNWNGFFSSLVASWSPDGKRVLFGSVRDGVPEIYAADPAKPGDPPVAITRGPERAIWARYTVDGKNILFLRDNKGDEQHHIWRANPDGSGAFDLSDGEALHRDEPVLPRKKPDTMIFSASKTSEPSVRVFVQNIFGGEPRLVFTNPRPGGLGEATSDGARVLFGEIRSSDDLVLSEIDVASGKAQRIYPAEGKKANVFSALYSPDDSRIYVSTDEGGESSVLVALDAKTGKELARYVNSAPPGAPMGAILSPKGDKIAVRVSAGNHGEIRILDAKTLKLQRAVKVPLGDIQIGSFRDDGKEFSILISLPELPADVYTVDATTGDVKPLRADKRPGLDSLPKIATSIESVKAFDGLTIPINRYLPKLDSPKKLPTIAIFHGGPASSYAVRWSPYVRFFVAKGYAVLEPNVRGSTGFGRAYEMADNREKRADWLKDLETVNAWAKAQPWCDPDKVVVWGQSYGGYTTLMALTRQPTLWRAGVNLYGVADLKTFLRTTDAAIRSVFVTEFGDLDKDGALLDEYSPMRDVARITAPLFVYTGQNDPRVPRSESDAIVKALRARNVPVEYMVAANEGHTVDRRETKVELLTRTARFLEDAMKSTPPR